MIRYFIEYNGDDPWRAAMIEDGTDEQAAQLVANGYTEVTKEEYDRCCAILFPPIPEPEPVTLEQVVQRVEVVENDMDSVKRGILDLSMQIPATQ